MRRLALAALEFFASCGDLNDYPAAVIAKSYRDLLRNQFHDILPAQEELMRQYVFTLEARQRRAERE